jgi:hypothetical protein
MKEMLIAQWMELMTQSEALADEHLQQLRSAVLSGNTAAIDSLTGCLKGIAMTRIGIRMVIEALP